MRIKKIDRFVAGAVIAVALPLGILLPAASANASTAGPRRFAHSNA